MTVLLGVSETVLDWDLFAYIQWSTAPCTFHWSNICLSMGEYETSVSLITSPLGDPCTCHLVFPPPELYINTRHNHNVHYCRTNLTLVQKESFILVVRFLITCRKTSKFCHMIWNILNLPWRVFSMNTHLIVLKNFIRYLLIDYDLTVYSDVLLLISRYVIINPQL